MNSALNSPNPKNRSPPSSQWSGWPGDSVAADSDLDASHASLTFSPLPGVSGEEPDDSWGFSSPPSPKPLGPRRSSPPSPNPLAPRRSSHKAELLTPRPPLSAVDDLGFVSDLSESADEKERQEASLRLKEYSYILRKPRPFIRHRVKNKQIVPGKAKSILVHCSQDLANICFFQRNSSVYSIPSTHFIDACIGLYFPTSEDNLSSMSVQHVDQSRVMTLFFITIKAIYLEAADATETRRWVQALLWLKSHVNRDRHAPAKRLNASSPGKPLSSGPLHMQKKHRYTLTNGAHFWRYQAGSTQPIPVWLDTEEMCTTLRLSRSEDCKLIEYKEVPAYEMRKIHVRAKTPIFGVNKWVFTITFKGNRPHPLHLAAMEEDSFHEWIDALNWLIGFLGQVGKPFNVANTLTMGEDMKLTGQGMMKGLEYRKHLGKGARGTVDLYFQHQFQTELAVKQYNKHSNLKAIEKEIDFMKETVKHKNTVGLVGTSLREDGQLWVLMEYCDGGSLDDLLQKSTHRLEEKHIAYILRETLLALKYLHQSCNIIHRDIKAANILFTLMGAIKVSDFGIAHMISPNDEKEDPGIAGSPLYMPPEIFFGKVPTPASDIWSTGIMAYELVHKVTPHALSATCLSELMQLIVESEPPSLPQSGPFACSEEFQGLIARMLVKDPAQRASVDELLEHPFIQKAMDHAKAMQDRAWRHMLQHGSYPDPSQCSLYLRSHLNSFKRTFSSATGKSATSTAVSAAALDLSRNYRKLAPPSSSPRSPPSKSNPSTVPSSKTSPERSPVRTEPSKSPSHSGEHKHGPEASSSTQRRHSASLEQPNNRGIGMGPEDTNSVLHTSGNSSERGSNGGSSSSGSSLQIPTNASSSSSSSRSRSHSCSSSMQIGTNASGSSSSIQQQQSQPQPLQPANNPTRPSSSINPERLAKLAKKNLQRTNNTNSAQVLAAPSGPSSASSRNNSNTNGSSKPAEPSRSNNAVHSRNHSVNSTASRSLTGVSSKEVGNDPYSAIHCYDFQHMEDEYSSTSQSYGNHDLLVHPALGQPFHHRDSDRKHAKMSFTSRLKRSFSRSKSPSAPKNNLAPASTAPLKSPKSTSKTSDQSPKSGLRKSRVLSFSGFARKKTNPQPVADKDKRKEAGEEDKNAEFQMVAKRTNSANSQSTNFQNYETLRTTAKLALAQTITSIILDPNVHPDMKELEPVVKKAQKERPRMPAPNPPTHKKKEILMHGDDAHEVMEDMAKTYKIDAANAEYMRGKMRLRENGLAREGTDQRDRKQLSLKESDLVTLGQIGRGVNGPVIKVLHLPSCTRMALKKLSVHSKATRHQLDKELSILTANVSSPHLISLLGAYYQPTQGEVCMATEYSDLGSLSSFVEKRGPIPERPLAYLTYQMFMGLDALHSSKYVHRDIKPENILLSHDGRVKIADFGLVTELTDNDLQKTRSFLGTIGYLSPERINLQAYSYPADVWAIGISLIYCAMGKLEWLSHNVWEMKDKLLSGQVNSLDKDRFSPQMHNFVRKCLEVDPEKRLTAQQALQHLWLKPEIEERSPDCRTWLDDIRRKGDREHLDLVLEKVVEFHGVTVMDFMWDSDSADVNTNAHPGEKDVNMNTDRIQTNNSNNTPPAVASKETDRTKAKPVAVANKDAERTKIKPNAILPILPAKEVEKTKSKPNTVTSLAGFTATVKEKEVENTDSVSAAAAGNAVAFHSYSPTGRNSPRTPRGGKRSAGPAQANGDKVEVNSADFVTSAASPKSSGPRRARRPMMKAPKPPGVAGSTMQPLEARKLPPTLQLKRSVTADSSKHLSITSAVTSSPLKRSFSANRPHKHPVPPTASSSSSSATTSTTSSSSSSSSAPTLASKKPGKPVFNTLIMPESNIETNIEPLDDPAVTMQADTTISIDEEEQEEEAEIVIVSEEDSMSNAASSRAQKPRPKLTLSTPDTPGKEPDPARSDFSKPKKRFAPLSSEYGQIETDIAFLEDSAQIVIVPEDSMSNAASSRAQKPRPKLTLSTPDTPGKEPDPARSDFSKPKKRFAPLSSEYRQIETDIAFLEEDSAPPVSSPSSKNKKRPALVLGMGSEMTSESPSGLTGAKLGFSLSLDPSGLESHIVPMEEQQEQPETAFGIIAMGDEEQQQHSTQHNTHKTHSSLRKTRKGGVGRSDQNGLEHETTSPRLLTLASEKVKFSPKLRPIINSLSGSYGMSELRTTRLLARKVRLEIVVPTSSATTRHT
eukprot:g16704.t1